MVPKGAQVGGNTPWDPSGAPLGSYLRRGPESQNQGDHPPGAAGFDHWTGGGGIHEGGDRGTRRPY